MKIVSIIFYQAVRPATLNISLQQNRLLFWGNRKRDKRERRDIRDLKKERFSVLFWSSQTAFKVIQITFCMTIHLHSVNSRLVDFQFRLIQYSFEGWWLRLRVYATWKSRRRRKRGAAVVELPAPPAGSGINCTSTVEDSGAFHTSRCCSTDVQSVIRLEWTPWVRAFLC